MRKLLLGTLAIIGVACTKPTDESVAITEHESIEIGITSKGVDVDQLTKDVNNENIADAITRMTNEGVSPADIVAWLVNHGGGFPPSVANQPVFPPTVGQVQDEVVPDPFSGFQGYDEENKCFHNPFLEGRTYIKPHREYEIYYDEEINPNLQYVSDFIEGMILFENRAPSRIAKEIRLIPWIIRPGVYVPQLVAGSPSDLVCYRRYILDNPNTISSDLLNTPLDTGNDRNFRVNFTLYLALHEFTHATHDRIIFENPEEDAKLEQLYQDALVHIPSTFYWTRNRYEFIAEVIGHQYRLPNYLGNPNTEPKRLYDELPGLAEWIERNFEEN